MKARGVINIIKLMCIYVMCSYISKCYQNLIKFYKSRQLFPINAPNVYCLKEANYLLLLCINICIYTVCTDICVQQTKTFG